MPYVNVKTTKSLNKEEKKALSHELARLIELVPGKSESWVMTTIEDNVYVTFGGTDDAPAAAVTIETFGELEQKYYDLITDELCKSFAAKLGIPADRTYIMYHPVVHWGWNHSNF